MAITALAWACGAMNWPSTSSGDSRGDLVEIAVGSLEIAGHPAQPGVGLERHAPPPGRLVTTEGFVEHLVRLVPPAELDEG